jgi:hypothetical protein
MRASPRLHPKPTFGSVPTAVVQPMDAQGQESVGNATATKWVKKLTAWSAILQADVVR